MHLFLLKLGNEKLESLKKARTTHITCKVDSLIFIAKFYMQLGFFQLATKTEYLRNCVMRLSGITFI